MTDRPTPTQPIRGWRRWRIDWPTSSKVAYLDAELTRPELVRRLLTADRVAQLVEDAGGDPWRGLDTSARLTKVEISAIILALSTPRTPLP